MQLLELNRRFYNEFGGEFSATRGRLQAGVQRVIESLDGDESILDLGCGNGELARTLSRRGHHGTYLGLDFSMALLSEAEHKAFTFPVQFKQADLAQLSSTGFRSPVNNHWRLVTALAVLHHIPGHKLRLNIVRKVHEWLEPNGLFIHSNWQFFNSEKLKARIQAWERIGLGKADVDANDYLLDWRRGGQGLRYVHHFDESELMELAQSGGFEIVDTFYSDGENKRLSIYQIWRKANRA